MLYQNAVSNNTMLYQNAFLKSNIMVWDRTHVWIYEENMAVFNKSKNFTSDC